MLAILLKTRSVTHTALQLKTSQPSVSRALAQLRRLLEDPLLVRKGGGMTLTRRGEELVAPLQQWLAATEALLEPPLFDPLRLKRRFRIASTDFGVSAVIAPVLPKFMTLAPQASIEVVPLKGGMTDELAAGDVDLLVSGLDPNPSQTHERYLFTEDFSCLFRAGHPLSRGRSAIPLDEFLEWPHIALTVGEHDFDRIESRLGSLGRRRIVARLPYFGASAEVIGKSDAVVTLPTRAARYFAAAHRLGCRGAPQEIGTFDYRLLWHERTARDAASVWLRDLLAEPHHSIRERPKSDLDICRL
ncbi:LysR family transcriptional regulator [Altererythrobacter sp. C41]|uniref:LysR family transcriptional regulator n=1 Tax=Altererythrobacter sp. C41 TaxID=2806021 RepID=UPI0030828BB1